MRRSEDSGVVRVSVNAAEIHTFAQLWRRMNAPSMPASNLHGLKGAAFSFRASTGELVSIEFRNGEIEDWDGQALVDLALGAQAYGMSRKVPQWLR